MQSGARAGDGSRPERAPVTVPEIAPGRRFARLPPVSARSVAWLAALVTGGLGLVAIAGWAFGIAAFRSVWPGWQTMSAVTALLLVIGAAELAILLKAPSVARRRLLMMAPGTVILTIGLITTALYSFVLFSGHEPSVGDIPGLGILWNQPTRLALLTAVLFVFAGSALLLLAEGSRRAADAAHALIIPVSMGGYLVVVSYLLGVSTISEFLRVSVAMNTGLAFCALSVAVFCARTDTWFMSVLMGEKAGSVMARRLLPAFLFLPIIIGWLRISGERAGVFGSEVGVVLVAMSYTVCLVAIAWLVARASNRTDDERFRAEEAVRESEARYRLLVHQAPAGIYDIDFTTGRFTEVNDVMCQILGYTRDEFLALTAFDILDDESRARFAERIRLSQSGKDPGDSAEYRVRTRDGRLIWALVTATFRRDAGRIVGATVVANDITGRKNAEEALRESEERYRNLFNSMNEGFCIIEMIFDAEGRPADYRFLELNAAFERQTGLHDAKGRLMKELAPAHEAHWFEIYGKIALTGEPARFENEARALGRWFEVFAYRVGRPQDRHVAIVFNDISERRKAEVALSETRNYLESLFDHANAPIIVWGPDFGITRFNRAFENLSGYTAVEVIGRKLEILFPDESKEDSLKKIARTATGEFWESIEIPILRKDGAIRIALWNSANIYGEDGRTIISTIAQGQDITERKKAEERAAALAAAVTAEKERLGALIDSIADEVWFADTEGKFILANATATKEFGLSPGTSVDVKSLAGSLEVKRPDGTLRPVDDAPNLRALRGETVRGMEEMVRTPATGELRNRLVSSAPVRDASGNIIGSVSVVKDITEQRRTEDALRKARELTTKQEKLAAIGRLAGGVAHELRNPLAAMKNAAYFLGMTVDRSDPSVADSLVLFNREIARADEIISSLLGLVQPARSVRRELDVNTILQDAVRAAHPPSGVSVEDRLDEALPPVMADPAQLGIVFGNLVRNAIEAMPGGGRLSVTSRAADGWVQVCVADTGTGITGEDFDRLFEPLFTTKQGGTGLGLSVAKMLVEGHGGTIEVESERGKGSIFTVRLPARGESGP